MRHILFNSQTDANTMLSAIDAVLSANGFADPWGIPFQLNGEWAIEDPREMMPSVTVEHAITQTIAANPYKRLSKPFLARVYTDGGQFKTSDGNQIVFHGVSLDSLNRDFGGKSARERIEQLLDEADWRVNMVRLPVQSSQSRAEGILNHMARWADEVVTICEERGIYCIIDWHLITNFDAAQTDVDIRYFWGVAASKFRFKRHCLYEMFNEPVAATGLGEAELITQEGWDLWKTYAQPWLDFIRTYAPDTVVLIGSPIYDQATHLARNNPMVGTNIGYVIHYYTNHMPNGQPDNNRTLQQVRDWVSSRITIPTQTLPYLMSEWGWALDYSKPTNYGDFSQGGAIFFTDGWWRFFYPLAYALFNNPNCSSTLWSFTNTSGPAMMQSQDPIVFRMMGKQGAEFLHIWFFPDAIYQRSLDVLDSGSLIDITSNIAAINLAEDYSFMVDYKTANITDNIQILGGDGNFGIRLTPTHIEAVHGDTVVSRAITRDAKRHKVGIRRKGNTLTLIYDGLLSNGTITNTPAINTFTLGSQNGNNKLIGEVNRFAVYDEAIKPEEIRLWMDVPHARIEVDTMNPVQNSVVTYTLWVLDHIQFDASITIDVSGDLLDADFDVPFLTALTAAINATDGISISGNTITVTPEFSGLLYWSHTLTKAVGNDEVLRVDIAPAAGSERLIKATLPVACFTTGTPQNVPTTPFIRGVNLSGAEFGGTAFYQTTADADVYLDKGFNGIRYPHKMERLMPTLGGALASPDKDSYKTIVDHITITKEKYCIIDPHNYIRYDGNIMGSDEFSARDLVDYWEKMADHLGQNDKVIYNLMNEPYGIPPRELADGMRACVAALRAKGYYNLILIPGDFYTKAKTFVSNQNFAQYAGVKFDPVLNWGFEVHQYFDPDETGTSGVCSTSKTTTLDELIDYANDYGWRLFLGEFLFNDNPDCRTVSNAIFSKLEMNNTDFQGWTAWGGGANWSTTYHGRLHPIDGVDTAYMLMLLVRVALPVPTMKNFTN